jgi:hypothetical protein
MKTTRLLARLSLTASWKLAFFAARGQFCGTGLDADKKSAPIVNYKILFLLLIAATQILIRMGIRHLVDAGAAILSELSRGAFCHLSQAHLVLHQGSCPSDRPLQVPAPSACCRPSAPFVSPLFLRYLTTPPAAPLRERPIWPPQLHADRGSFWHRMQRKTRVSARLIFR